MKFFCVVLVLVSVVLCFSRALTPIDSVDDMLAEESQPQSARTRPDVEASVVREKRGFKYKSHYKQTSVGGLFPFKQTVEHKVHIKHGHGLLGGHYREVTKVKQFGLGR